MSLSLGAFDHDGAGKFWERVDAAGRSAGYEPRCREYADKAEHHPDVAEKLAKYDVVISHGLSVPNLLVEKSQARSVRLFVSSTGWGGLSEQYRRRPRIDDHGIFVLGLVQKSSEVSEDEWISILTKFKDPEWLRHLVAGSLLGDDATAGECFFPVSRENLEALSVLCQGFLGAHLNVDGVGNAIGVDDAHAEALGRMEIDSFIKSDEGWSWWTEFTRKDSNTGESLQGCAQRESSQAEWWRVLFEGTCFEAGAEELRRQWGSQRSDVFDECVKPLIDEVALGGTVSPHRVVQAYLAIDDQLTGTRTGGADGK